MTQHRPVLDEDEGADRLRLDVCLDVCLLVKIEEQQTAQPFLFLGLPQLTANAALQ